MLGSVNRKWLVQCKHFAHAIAVAQEAIEGYLEVLMEEGKPIPKEPVTTPVDTLIQVKSPAVA